MATNDLIITSAGTEEVNGNRNENTVNQTVVTGIQAPRLSDVYTESFNEFKRKREVYEEQVNEKNQQPGVNVKMTTYKMSIDRRILKLMVSMQWVEAAKIEDITEQQLKQCINERSKKTLDVQTVVRAEDDLKDVKMNPKVARIEARVWGLYSQYLKVLEDCGYEDLPENYPHIAIQHIRKRIEPRELRDRMNSIVNVRKNEKFHEKDLAAFMRELAVQGKAMDDDRHHRGQTGSSDDTKDCRPSARSPSQRKGKKPQQNNVTKGKEKNRHGKREREAPKCLNPKCGRHCWMNECPNTSEELKKKLLAEYREKKKQRNGSKLGEANRLCADEIDSHSSLSLFTATLADGAVECIVLADQGSDGNIIPQGVFKAYQHAKPSTKVTKLNKPKRFRGVGGGSIVCHAKVVADISLRIRHANKLVLRNVEWFVSDEDEEKILLSRHTLSAIGIDNKKLIEEVCQRYNGVFDMNEMPVDDEDTPKIVSMAEDRDEICGVFNLPYEDDPAEDDVYIDLGEDTPEELDAEIAKRLGEAESNGISNRGLKRLKKLFEKFRSIFRIRLGKSAPAKIPPMKIDLDPRKKSVKAKVRRYSPRQRAFLKKYIEKLIELGFLIPNPDASWQAAPHLVDKLNSKAEFRVTTDTRPVNSATIKKNWPMPNLDTELNDFVGSKVFATLDFCSGYWQLAIHPDSYDACGIITPFGVFSATRVLQGLMNAVAHFQASVEPLFAELRPHLKAWIDDFNLHNKDEDGLLSNLEKFCQICLEHGLFISIKKSTFFAKEVKWCGRIIDEEGYRMDPSKGMGLRTMDLPVTADELCQFVHCCRWMKSTIPDFNKEIAPLVTLLEKAYMRAGKRKKRALKGIKLADLGWGEAETTSFTNMQATLNDSIKLAYPRKGNTICIFTDASNKYWSGVVTQVKSESLKEGGKPIEQLDHEPLCFLSGDFSNSSLNWTTYEKEAFAIFTTFRKLDFMLVDENPVHVFTDHRNLLYVFAPTCFQPKIGQHIISKVQRWAIFLSQFDYTIEHIDGERNVFADILTRWTRGYRTNTAQTSQINALILDQLIPSASEATWPCLEDIKSEQESMISKPRNVRKDDDDVYRKDGKIWIPNESLQLKVIIASHCGEMGHRGRKATESIIKESFWWPSISKAVVKQVDKCLHCLVSRAGETVPRPMGSTMHAKQPNEIIHVDYLYMGESANSDLKYILIIRDDLSSYVWLWPTASATSECAADALIQWFTTFGSSQWLVTDQGSHFTSSIMKELTEELKLKHHLTTAYCPWANGSVERICREVKRACTALLSEFKLSPLDWPSVLECITSVLNHAPFQRLGARNSDEPSVFRTPLEVFTSHVPTRPLLRALPLEDHQHCESLSEVRAHQLICIGKVQAALENMHRDVAERSSVQRDKAIKRHNELTNVRETNFGIGDFVLVRKPQKKGHKLQPMWRGPYRILEAKSDFVFTVEHLQSLKREDVHATRMILYRADMDGREVDQRLLDQAQHLSTTYQVVIALHDLRERDDGIQVRVEWDGLPDPSDHSWEPLRQLNDDAPGILQQFLQSNTKRDLKTKAARLLRQ